MVCALTMGCKLQVTQFIFPFMKAYKAYILGFTKHKLNMAQRMDAYSKNMNGVLGHDSALEGSTGAGTIWANKMNFSMIHAPCAG